VEEAPLQMEEVVAVVAGGRPRHRLTMVVVELLMQVHLKYNIQRGRV
jgi:hypothetical protein